MFKFNVLLASDHAGFKLKSELLAYLKNKKFHVVDLGTNSEAIVDYPDYAKKLADKMIDVVDDDDTYGILICKHGIGMSIAANRYSYIRAALCVNETMSEYARAHNNANVLVLASNITSTNEVYKIVDKFFYTDFNGGHHILRLAKI